MKNWKKVFMQIKNKKRHFCKYENEMWNVTETKYDAIKRKCREILKCFKKFRYYLYDVHFILKIDAKILIAQFNCSNTDFSDAFLTRWIAWICLFDFNVRHVKNKKHIAADELSRKSAIEEKRQTINKKMNIDEWIELKLKSLRMFSVILSAKERILKNEYFDKSEKIVRDFMTLQKSSKMNTKKFRKWKTDVFKFKIQNRYFFRRNSKNIFMRRVVNNLEKKNIKKFTWRNRTSWKKKTYRRIADRYWWNHLYEKIRNYVKNCDRCQLCDSTREKKTLHSIWISCLWKKIAVDVMHMFMNHEKSFLIVARNDLFEWIKVQFLSATNVDKIFEFLWKNVICRHDCFEKLIIDDKFENRDWVANLFEKYDNKRVMISAYHFQTNDMMEKNTNFWSMRSAKCLLIIAKIESSICQLFCELIDQQ